MTDLEIDRLGIWGQDSLTGQIRSFSTSEQLTNMLWGLLYPEESNG